MIEKCRGRLALWENHDMLMFVSSGCLWGRSGAHAAEGMLSRRGSFGAFNRSHRPRLHSVADVLNEIHSFFVELILYTVKEKQSCRVLN